MILNIFPDLQDLQETWGNYSLIMLTGLDHVRSARVVTYGELPLTIQLEDVVIHEIPMQLGGPGVA